MPRKKAIDEPIPLQIVKQMSDAFPGCYDEVEKMRRDKGKGLPDWDDRCYIPINATLAIMDLYRGKILIFIAFPLYSPPLPRGGGLSRYILLTKICLIYLLVRQTI